MILDALTGKALPYTAGVVVLLLSVMAGAICLLMQERDSLNQSIGQISQANEQYAETIQLNATDYDALQSELEHRDAIAARAMKDHQQAQRKANETVERLRLALQADDCANTRHPDVVGDSLRTHTTTGKD